MLWFLILVSLVSAAIDLLVYKRRIRYRSRKYRHVFIALVASSDLLPIVVLSLMKLLPDTTETLIRTAQWTTFLYLLLLGSRFGYYFGLLFDRRRRISRMGIVFGVAIAVWFVWGATYGRSNIVINQVEVRSEKLPAAFDDFRIVQFSDLHIGTLVDPEREIDRLVRTIRSLRPDLVVFSGDLVNIRYSELTPRICEILQGLDAPYGVVSTLGNHDVGIYIRDTLALTADRNTRLLVELQHAMGWRVLQDSTIRLHRGADSISVTGISFDRSLWEFRHSCHLPEVSLGTCFAGASGKMFNLAVSHLPQLWPDIVALGYGDLTLSGHVHSMQLKFRLFGRSFSPARLMYDRWSGRYEDGSGHTLYINDGIGYVGFPMRLGAYPEVTLFILKK